ncbi:MAG: N-acetyltransferase [Hyphobacterium sp.]|nr:MAG: N-acetyltransferase [Hyphobacterium sp.]
MTITYLGAAPPVRDFVSMRAACGWGEVSPAIARCCLSGSVASVTAMDETKQTIGFCRAFGDSMYVYIQDVIVRPEFRGKKIGEQMMHNLLGQIRTKFPSASIMLMCAKGQEDFYARFGFTPRPDGGFGPGMQILSPGLP